MELSEYIKELSRAELEDFAARCGTTIGQMRQVSYGRRAGESLAINIDRETCGAVPCETLRPDVDWSYIRGTKKKARA